MTEITTLKLINRIAYQSKHLEVMLVIDYANDEFEKLNAIQAIAYISLFPHDQRWFIEYPIEKYLMLLMTEKIP